MRKIVRRTGNSLCIIFNREDQEVYKLDEGDIIEVSIIKLKKAKKK